MGSTRGAIAATVLAVLAGCGGGTGGQPAEKPESQGATVEDQLGFTRRGIAAAQAKVENAIAACMKSQGFEYVPVDSVAEQAALTGRPNMSDQEFERQFGYGISTLYGRASRQSDPNAAIRARLGRADRRAYDEALSGGRPEQTFFLAVDTGDFSRLGGCTKQATEALFGGTELVTTLQRKLGELDDEVVADQRMVRAAERWRSCVHAASGETYEDAEAIEEELAKRLEAIVGPPTPPGRIASRRSYDRAALRALQRAEVEIANQDYACERRHIVPVEDVVRAEKERRFREENAELLRRVKPLGS